MAFGFGFNKQKVLNAAEKFVQQGKLQNAITEYEKVLKADPKDLTVMNTVGDLYARLGNNDKAVECFKSVGDAYASQGFTVKAIAMYKKISKLKSTLEGVLRLAELYTQQGLFNDARAQYLQVAEEFLREGQLEQAVRIFQKTLEMDPENVAMRTRLAEVYVRLGKKDEAYQIFAAAAESLRAKGQLGPAEELLQRMLKLDPGNGNALLLRGRTAFDNGDMAAAVECLEKVADLDSHPDGLQTLLQAYLRAGKLAQAGTLADKLLSVHNDVAAVLSYAEALVGAGQFEDALKVYQQHSDRLLAANSEKILESLHSLIGHVHESSVALEMVLELLNKGGDTSHITEVYELLAHSYVQSGELEKARDYYLKLTQLEPENQIHAKNYQQVIAKLGTGSGSHMITAEEGAVMVDELEATAPFVDQRYDDEVALALRAALTDAELFISYNMPAKALGPLLAALPQAPRDLRINQRLAALHTRAGRFTEAAVCCRTLESIYHEAGHPEEATRYGELASKYEARAGAAATRDHIAPIPAETHAAVASFPVVSEAPELVVEPPSVIEAEEAVVPPPAAAAPAKAPARRGLFFHAPAAPPVAEKPAPAPQPAAAPEKEIDLSDEWEGTVSEEPTVSVPDVESGPVEVAANDEPEIEIEVPEKESVPGVIEEIRFYLANGMNEEAFASFMKLEELKPGADTLSSIRAEIDAVAKRSPVVEAEPAVEEVSVEPEEFAIETNEETPEPQAEPERAAGPTPTRGVLDEFVSDLESSLGDGFLPQTAVKEVEIISPPQAPAAGYAQSAAEPAARGNLGEFVSDLESSLGDSFLPEAPVVQHQVQARPKPEAPRKIKSAEHAAPVNAPPKQVPSAAMAAAAGAHGSAAPVAPPVAAPAFTYQPTPIRPLSASTGTAAAKFDSATGVDLADMFGELKQELEEDTAAGDEDPETHYNLGVAFREMGLLDEAIGELQKVCQAVERGHSFPHIMQTYTWLSQCFLDKGVPQAAIRWYEKALALPTLDQDTRTALHYELASSYETAGNKPAALNHFMEVYGSNIDYRDVAERIRTLKS